MKYITLTIIQYFICNIVTAVINFVIKTAENKKIVQAMNYS